MPSSCLRDEDVVALFEGRLPVSVNVLAHHHAARCAACRTLLVTLAHGDALPSDSVPLALLPLEQGRRCSRRPSVPDATWTPPAVLDGFRLERLLGRGGMGAVYLAQDARGDRRVALKVCVALQPDERALASFATEARAIARIQHPNVVTMERVGEVDGRPYLVYEYVDGKSLAELRPPLPWPRVLDIAVGLAAGLRAAHQCGVLHRDLKPGNAILEPDGTVKLIDFGLATFVGSGGTAPRGVREVVGTPRYMAPEIRMGESATARSDLYALGLLVFELCTGRLPPVRRGACAAFKPEAGRGPAALLTEWLPGIDPGFAAVIACCLAEDPSERFAQADVLCAVLEHVRRLVAFQRTSRVFPTPWMGAGFPPPKDEGILAGHNVF
ncbi:serine/threonine-protein kinase [Corallococcus carmarthensis]|uniref:serine/threonine-protein kinase n=1 Tax=Corallococcus carmarthensis TaxID=2316728 RepID=UPI0013154BBB|nr:serine/threonine-protein kinase [Corallococcus carmarthensis]